MGVEEKKFNTKFGCENMACRPFPSEPLEMLQQKQHINAARWCAVPEDCKTERFKR
jgi:hypothetical protein